MRRIMRWLGIHEERMNMDAVYAARHEDSFVADIIANEKSSERDEMLDHVDELTAYWTGMDGNVQSSGLVKGWDSQLERLLQEEEWLEFTYRHKLRWSPRPDPYLHVNTWVLLVGHNHGVTDRPWYVHEYIGVANGEHYYILGNGPDFRLAPIGATRPFFRRDLP